MSIYIYIYIKDEHIVEHCKKIMQNKWNICEK